MLIEIIFWAFVIYLVYKFIFELIIPTGNVAVQMKEKIRQMQETQQRMQQQMNQQEQQQQATQKKAATPPPAKDDYIDFEEVKK